MNFYELLGQRSIPLHGAWNCFWGIIVAACNKGQRVSFTGSLKINGLADNNFSIKSMNLY